LEIIKPELGVSPGDGSHQSEITIYAGYRAFLLRIWQESPRMPWRASLQCTRTGQRRGFPDLDSLFAFLQAELETTPLSADDEHHIPGEG